MRNERGAALVEFALVLPMLLVVVLGSLALVWMLTARSALTGAARDGARFASIRHDPICDQPTCPTDWPTQDEVAQFVRTRAGGFQVDGVELTPPTQSNEEVVVTVHGHLPTLFQPIGALLGDRDYVTVGRARAE
jgi:Flp pilus assembly pilin Flp